MIVNGTVKDNRILLDPNIQLPDGIQVSIIVPDTVEPPNDSGADFMQFAGIWEGLTDEDLGLDDLDQRRRNFFSERQVEL